MSATMKALRAFLALQPKRLQSVASTRDAIENGAAPASVPHSLARSCEVIPHIVDGMMVMTLTPRRGPTGTQFIYLHGGSFVFEMISPHWQIIGDLIRRTGATVSVPYYPLAPAYDATFAFPRLMSLYAQLRSQHSRVIVAGDSVGGNLALSLAIQLREAGTVSPDALTLFSPFVDTTVTNPEMASIEPRDPLLGIEGLRWTAEQWAGPLSLHDPRVSPLFDHFRGLPPISTYQGGCDLFAPDVKLFDAKARAAGTRSELRFYPTGSTSSSAHHSHPNPDTHSPTLRPLSTDICIRPERRRRVFRLRWAQLPNSWRSARPPQGA